MVPIQITSNFHVSAQPKVSDFKFLADQDIALILNNRPDGEEAGQPGTAAEAEAAHKLGMGYRHIPVTGETLSEADVREFQQAVADSAGPVLAHCKSGTRALTLWVLGEVLDGRMAATDILPFGKRFGFDLTTAANWFAKRTANGAA